jgi:hypothetical protein
MEAVAGVIPVATVISEHVIVSSCDTPPLGIMEAKDDI